MHNIGSPIHGKVICVRLQLFLPRDAMHGADYAVARCLWSVTRRFSVEMAKQAGNFISPSGSHTILVFPNQTAWHYSDNDALTGRRMQGWYEKNRNFRPIIISL